MSHSAFDIAKALSGPLAAGAHSAAPAGKAPATAGGFDGHLQRAGRDGGRSNSRQDHSDGPRRPVVESGNRPAGSHANDPDADGPRRDSGAHEPKPTASNKPDDGGQQDGSNSSTTSESANRSTGDRPDQSNKSSPDPADPEATVTAAQLVTAAANVAQSAASPDSSADSPVGDPKDNSQLATGVKSTPPPPIPGSGNLAAVAATSTQSDASPPSAQAANLGAGSIQISTANSSRQPTAQSEVTLAASQVATAVTSSDLQPTSSANLNQPIDALSEAATVNADAAVSTTSESAEIGATEMKASKRSIDEQGSPQVARGPRGFDPIATIAAVVQPQIAATAAGFDSQQGSDASKDDESTNRKTAAPAAVSNSDAKVPSPPPSPSSTQTFGHTPAQSNDSSTPATAPDRSPAGSGVGDVDRVRFLQRVSTAFRAADEQGGQIRLRLSPPELGSLKLELSVHNGLMTAHVQAETDTARNLLLDHLPQLRERLADHNIKIDHFDVELMNQQSGTPQNYSQNPNDGSSPPQFGPRRPATPAVTAGAIAPAASVRLTNSQLDVTI